MSGKIVIVYVNPKTASQHTTFVVATVYVI